MWERVKLSQIGIVLLSFSLTVLNRIFFTNCDPKLMRKSLIPFPTYHEVAADNSDNIKANKWKVSLNEPIIIE